MPTNSYIRFPRNAIPEDFGIQVAKARLRMLWSQQDLADAADLRRETVTRLEKGGGRRPTADTVFRIEAALGLETGDLVPDWPEWSPINSRSCGAQSRELRRRSGQSLAEVARKAGVSVSSLARFEREMGAVSSLAVCGSEEGMVTVVALVSDDYARALGFRNADEHYAWCVRVD